MEASSAYIQSKDSSDLREGIYSSNNNNMQSQWTPISKNTLDLRLSIFKNEDKENNLLAIVASEMKENLKILHTQASSISAQGLTALAENCPNVEVLNLCCAYKIGDKALEIISQFTKLKELNLNCAAKKEILDDWGSTGRAKVIEGIKDTYIVNILNKCSELEKLDLSGTQITLETLKVIATRDKIKFLRLAYCWDLKDEEISYLAKARPDVQIMRDLKDDASSEFITLAKSMKSRYYKETQISKGEISISFKDDVSELEKDFISLSTFYI